MKVAFSILLVCLLFLPASPQAPAKGWLKFEQTFTSATTYGNPLYDLRECYAVFTAPSGRTQRINGFRDGGVTCKVCFAPDETGRRTFEAFASDGSNSGLIEAASREEGDFVLVLE